MRKFLVIIFILYFIGFVFFKSNTIETRQWKENRNGIEYLRTSYNLSWNNFTRYLTGLYQNAIFRLKKLRGN